VKVREMLLLGNKALLVFVFENVRTPELMPTASGFKSGGMVLGTWVTDARPGARRFSRIDATL